MRMYNDMGGQGAAVGLISGWLEQAAYQFGTAAEQAA